jgi:hypothetical protein
LKEERKVIGLQEEGLKRFIGFDDKFNKKILRDESREWNCRYTQEKLLLV